MENIESVVILIVIVWFLYRAFFKPLRKYEDYIKRMTKYEMIFLKRAAVNVMHKALDDQRLSAFEKSSIFLEVGVRYFQQKEYEKSCSYFDQSFDIALDTPFRYTKKLKLVLKSYLLANRHEDAKALYYNFLDREKYDPNFKKISQMYKMLNP